MLETISAGLLVVATLLVFIFQLAIVFGAPLGAYSYGGANQGQLPTRYRISSVVSAITMLAISGHYLAQLGVFQPLLDVSGNQIVNWVLVGFFTLAAIANNITRSVKERAVWAAPTILMLLASVAVALEL